MGSCGKVVRKVLREPLTQQVSELNQLCQRSIMIVIEQRSATVTFSTTAVDQGEQSALAVRMTIAPVIEARVIPEEKGLAEKPARQVVPEVHRRVLRGPLD